MTRLHRVAPTECPYARVWYQGSSEWLQAVAGRVWVQRAGCDNDGKLRKRYRDNIMKLGLVRVTGADVMTVGSFVLMEEGATNASEFPSEFNYKQAYLVMALTRVLTQFLRIMRHPVGAK